MCVILICPPEVRPSPDVLQLCFKKNPHGAGIAWRRRGAVEWLKTDNLELVRNLVNRLEGEIVVHFRIATVGGACPELRHPFPITLKAGLERVGRASAVLFQNGTWRTWGEAIQREWESGHRPPVGPVSDTRAAAWLCHLHGHRYLRRCGDSRWVYFSGSETVRYGQWFKREGIYFSNLNWLSKTHSKGLS